jgi:hypothetical protein
MLSRIHWAACLPAAITVAGFAVAAGILVDRADADNGGAPTGTVTTGTSPAAIGSTTFAYRDLVVWADESPALQPLTPDQCKMAASVVHHTGKSFPEFIAAQGPAILADFTTEQAAAEAWVKAGCPPDPERGGFIGSNGTVQLKPYARQSFSASSDGAGGTYLVISAQ